MNKIKISLILVVILLVFGFSFLSFKKVSAADMAFTVNSLSDDSDDTLDGICSTSLDECTLRAALEEANNVSSEDHTVINFDESILPGTIYVNEDELPTFERNISIIGPGNDELVIDGTNTNNDTVGLRSWRNTSITGLKIQNFPQVGIYVAVCDNCNTSNYLTTINSNTLYNNGVGIYLSSGWHDDNSSFVVSGNDISGVEMRVFLL